MWISKKDYEAKINESYRIGKLENIELENERARRSQAESIIQTLEKTNEYLCEKFREQSEADMVLSALKVIMKAVNGETKEQIQPLYNSMLATQQNMGMGYAQGIFDMNGLLGGIWQTWHIKPQGNLDGR